MLKSSPQRHNPANAGVTRFACISAYDADGMADARQCAAQQHFDLPLIDRALLYGKGIADD